MSAEEEKDTQVVDNLMVNSLISDAMDWFVVKTKPRHEKKVAELAQKNGYVVFLPLQTTLRIWSDRKKKVQTPLIPSVLFIQNPEIHKDSIYAIPGFLSVLKLNGKIARVKPHEIEQLKIVIGAAMEVEQDSPASFHAGEEVEIVGGPLCGYFAKAIEDLTTYRVLIEIPTLGVGYSFNVAKNNIRKR